MKKESSNLKINMSICLPIIKLLDKKIQSLLKITHTEFT